MKIFFTYLLLSSCLLTGCTQTFTVVDAKDFERKYQHVYFVIKFSGLNAKQIDELSQYQVGKFHCTNHLKSGQIITGLADKMNRHDLTSRVSLFSCAKNSANDCYTNNYIEIPSGTEIKCYIAFNSILKRTYQTKEFKLVIP